MTLDKGKLDRVVRRGTETIEPRVFVVSGILERIEYADDKFILRIDRNKRLFGQIEPEKLNFELIGPLWGKPTTVKGVVHFKANGTPRFILARRIGAKSSRHNYYERLPTGVQDDTERMRKAANFNLSTLWGKWPGEETFEELMEILESMRNPIV